MIEMASDRRRIFISHSSNNGATAGEELYCVRFRDALYNAIPKDTYDVFLDKESLQKGSNWREHINRRLDDCHAAIVLVSKRALRADAWWVPYEVAVLGRRADRPGTRFRLFPVHLVSYDSVQDWKAADPTEALKRQPISAPWQETWAAGAPPNGLSPAAQQALEQGVAQVVSKLESAVPGPTPLERTAKPLTELLENMTESFCKHRLGELGEAPGFSIDSDPLAYKLAVTLLSKGLNESRTVLWRIRGDPGETGRRILPDVVDILACAWVDEGSLSVLRKAVDGERAVATTAAKPLTAEFYVWRGLEEPYPSLGWKAVVLNFQAGGNTLAEQQNELRVEILKSLIATFQEDDQSMGEEAETLLTLPARDATDSLLDAAQAKVDAMVSTYAGVGPRFFVVLKRSELNASLLGFLKQRFPGISFFLLGCARPNEDSLIRRGKVALLEPFVETSDESRYHKDYNELSPVLTGRPVS